MGPILYTFTKDFNEGIKSTLNSLEIPNQEEWLIDRMVALPFKATFTGYRSGQTGTSRISRYGNTEHCT